MCVVTADEKREILAPGSRIILKMQKDLEQKETRELMTETGIITGIEKAVNKRDVELNAGIVLSIGPHVGEVMPGIKVGDTVRFQRYNGIEVENYSDRDYYYRSIDCTDVYAIERPL